MAHRFAIALVGAAIVAGTWSDRVPPRTVRVIGPYRVIAADFHVHPVLLSAFDLVLEARRRGLDAFALTPHNQIVSGTIGQWFARAIGGPTVIVGEEVRPQTYHIIAVGVHESVRWRQPAASTIADIHRQGGIAIAAHPDREYWPAFDAAAIRSLDGAEVAHPTAFVKDDVRADMEAFFGRTSVAAIGSSDYHGLTPMGTARTYVFATDASEAAILDAIRHRRTVVYSRDGRVFGDPELIRLSAGTLPTVEQINATASASHDVWLAWFSRIAGIGGLLLVSLRSTQNPAGL